MSDKPKFEVIDRRKIKAEEEQENQQPSAPEAEAASAPPKPGAGPQPGCQRAESEAPAEAGSRVAPRAHGPGKPRAEGRL